MNDSWKFPPNPMTAWYMRAMASRLYPSPWPVPRRDPRGKRKEPAKGVQKRNRRGNRRKHRKG